MQLKMFDLLWNSTFVSCFPEKGSAFDEVTYWFIKLIYHFKTANFPLIEYQIYAVINNRLTKLSS